MNKSVHSRKIANNRYKIVWMGLFGLGLLLIGFAILFSLQRSREKSALPTEYSVIPLIVNYPSPEINLTDLFSRNVSLKNHRDGIVLVNNWATWCPPCKAEMPTLEKYYTEHANQGFVIIAIESGEPIDEVIKFVEAYGLSFPVWIDKDGAALEAFNNWNLPSSYVIDRNGMIRLTWTGEISLAMLEKYVTPLIFE